MKIDGFMLQQAIREARNERDGAAARFSPSLTAFPNENKPDPRVLAEQYQTAENRLALFQTVQTQFNLQVEVEVQGERMTLLQAIKSVGGAGRLEKMWRAASTPNQDRYSYREETRDKDAIVAVRQIGFDDAAALAQRASKRAAALRAAIAKGNAQEMTLALPAEMQESLKRVFQKD